MYIEIFVVCISLFVNYFILECLFMSTHDFHNLGTLFYTFGWHITPWTAGTCPKLQIKNVS